MFIELAEFLQCPEPHGEQSYCVLVPDAMAGRDVRAGAVGCPVCQREYTIADGVVHFRTGDAAPGTASDASLPEPEVVHALLGLVGPGGYVALVGGAARLATLLASLLPSVHFVGVNAPPGVVGDDTLSLLRDRAAIPLRSSCVRAVVVGAEHAAEPWLGESARVLLRGLRIVVLREGVSVPGCDPLASGMGMWVGKKIGGGPGT